MADLVRLDGFPVGHICNVFRRAMSIPFQGARVFYGPDGLQYRWRPSPPSLDILVRSGIPQCSLEALTGHASWKTAEETLLLFFDQPDQLGIKLGMSTGNCTSIVMLVRQQ